MHNDTSWHRVLLSVYLEKKIDFVRRTWKLYNCLLLCGYYLRNSRTENRESRTLYLVYSLQVTIKKDESFGTKHRSTRHPSDSWQSALFLCPTKKKRKKHTLRTYQVPGTWYRRSKKVCVRLGTTYIRKRQNDQTVCCADETDYRNISRSRRVY